jgi:hypothetical protein
MANPRYFDSDYVTGVPFFDPAQTIASQYQNSPTLLSLIESMRQNLLLDDTFEKFYEYVWDIDTAQGFGLDILGRVLNIPRQFNVPAIFPFDAPSGLLSLNDDQYRIVLRAKAATNISVASIPAINAVLRTLFAGRGNAYVVNVGNMHMSYSLLFAVTGVEFGIMQQQEALPAPAAVQIDGIQSVQNYFGFAEAGSWSTFGENTFASY